MLEKNSQRLNMNRFIVEALEAHNKYRAYHNARPLVINDEISKIAQEVINNYIFGLFYLKLALIQTCVLLFRLPITVLK